MSPTTIAIISILLIVVGIVGAVLPVLPGLPVAMLGLILFAWVTDAVSIWAIVVFAILTGLTIILDIAAPGLAAKGRKASRAGIVGAILGTLIGIFTLGPIGILLGPFVGAFVGEMIHSANTEHALRIALASLLGLVIAGVFKLIVGLSMLIYFVIVLLKYF